MSSPWKIDPAPVEVETMDNIMSEQYANRILKQELKKYEKQLDDQKTYNIGNEELSLSPEVLKFLEDDGKETIGVSCNSDVVIAQVKQLQKYEKQLKEQASGSRSGSQGSQVEEALPSEVLEILKNEEEKTESEGCKSDAVIAQMLQLQYDHEYNKELRRIEQKQNKQSKVTVTLEKYLRHDALAEYLQDSDVEEEEDEEERHKRDWDRFETNEKRLDAIPKCGYMVDRGGEMITKHDPQLCGVRNACRVMSFPPEFPTGDGASFEMKLPNKIYNELKRFSRRENSMSGSNKKNNMHDRKATASTAEMSVDEPTRLLLYKLINNQILEQINGIISTGKEAVILHANSDPTYSAENKKGSKPLTPVTILPKECAVKIFKTTLNEFKQRDRYIKDDYRFKDRFGNQNKRVVINMWAEKEMLNLMRMQNVGINCPEMVMLKKHVLVMSFIGDNHNAAPKLKDAHLSAAELSVAYEEIVAAMHKLYNEAKLVHADLSEYNILWYDGKCWFIDVAQAIGPEHPSALEFLMRDCANIINFFSKRGVPNIYSKEELFEHITALNAEVHNAAMLERIHTRGPTMVFATAPDQTDCPDELRPLEYPFELAWEKSLADKKQKLAGNIDQAGKALDVLSVKCGTVPVAGEQQLRAELNSK